MAISTINISIPDSLRAEVEEIIDAEGYGNTSEFFRDLVRNYIKRRQELKLETLLLEGLESGDATPLTKADFEEIKKRKVKDLKEHLEKAVERGGSNTSEEVKNSVKSKLKSLDRS